MSKPPSTDSPPSVPTKRKFRPLPPRDPTSEILTIEDVESIFRIGRGTQGAMRTRKQIPYLKIGGIIRYRRSELEQWLAAKAAGAR